METENRHTGIPEWAPWAQVLAVLRTRTLYDEHPLWDYLLQYQVDISQHLAKEGLELLIDRTEGFACLFQIESEDGRTVGLMRRSPLSYDLSLICVLLRHWLDEFDISAHESRHLYITHSQLQERILVFFPEQNNQSKLLRELDRLINKMVDYGFLDEQKSQNSEPLYRVMRVIKARVSLDDLQAFLNKQEAYAQSLQSESC